MTLLEVCEPWFQYICRLSRSARKGGQFDAMTVRGDLKSLMEEMKNRAASSGELATQFEKVRLPLIFFADFMIKESDLPFAREWTELAREDGEHAGDEKFFDMLDETLADKSTQASERLAIYYSCIGLGFTGFYTGQPEYLRKTMTEMSSRIRDKIDLSDSSRICPEAYEHVNTADLIQPPGAKLVGIVIGFVGLIIVLFIANIMLFQQSRSDLGNALEAIQQEAVSPASSGSREMGADS